MGIPEHLLDTVFLGDVMELLRLLPDRSVDRVFSDPDYNVGVKYNGKSYKRAFEEYIEWYIELARESLRVLKDDGNMFFINYPKQNAYLRVRFLDDACYKVIGNAYSKLHSAWRCCAGALWWEWRRAGSMPTIEATLRRRRD